MPEIINKIVSQEVDEVALEAEWERIVRAGKHSKKLTQNAKVRGKSRKDPKYYDPNYMEHTGAVDADEFVFLHKAVKYFTPANILEVGTWFGTSANAMASALPEGGKVYTCDKYDLFVGERPNIVYHNCISTKLIDRIVAEGIKIDMAFWDAKFMRGDSDKLLQMVKPLIFLTHDYFDQEKGWRCVQELKEKLGDRIKVEHYGIIGVVICE